MNRAEHILSFFGGNVAIAVAGVTLSASVAWHGVDRVQGQAEQEFVTLVDDHTSRIQELYDLNVATQESVNSFFHASQTVTQEEFNRFLDYGGRKHAPFVAMQYAPRVSLEDRRDFESELKSTYGAETGIWENAGNNKPAPAGERNEYFPILFAFPDTMTPLRGFDVGSEANRRAALALAAVSGKPAMTDPIRLIQHPDDWGFLIFAPFRPSGEQCKDETSCVASVIGFSVGAYRFRAVPQSVIHSTRSGRYDLLIYARDSLDADPVYVHYTDAAEAHTNRGPTLREAGSRSVQWRDVQVAQRTLKLGFINKRPAVGLGELAGPLSQLVLGLLLTGLILIGRARTLRNLSELRERDRQWATLVSNLPGLVYRCRNDPNWTMEFVSDGITAISGYSHEEFEKQTLHYGDLIIEEDRQRVWQTVQNAIGSKKPFHMEYRIRAADGKIKWVWEHGCGVYEKDNLLALEGFVTDITERRRAAELLLQTEKLDAIGKLTGGMAHDFNNLLSIIIGSLDLALMRLGDKGKLKEHIETSLGAALRGAEVIKSLLAIARRQPLEHQDADINQALDGMLPLIRQTVGPAIEVRTAVSEAELPVRLDVSAFQSAVLNLVVNARDAMPAGGILLITTRRETALAGGGADLVAEAVAYAVVEVRDNGVGMPREVALKAFEPFFTTKEREKGTGLGLSAVYGFARQSSGTVTLDSEPGNGTTVRLFLPLATKSEAAPAAEARPIAKGTGERVLLVDDEHELASVAKEWLEDMGYTVSTAPNAIVALEMLKTRHWDVLLSDIVMPGGMDGLELAEKVAALYPRMKILLSSGYAERSFRQDAVKWRVLAKPFRKNDLSIAIRAALSEKM